MGSKIKVTRKDMEVVKSFFQIQVLLETLDDVYYSTTFNVKKQTSKYLEFLKIEVEPILKSMYVSNPKLYQTIIDDLRNNVNEIEKYFKIIN